MPPSDPRHRCYDGRIVRRPSASPFRNDNQSAFISVRIALANRGHDLLPFERDFRQKDDISPPGDASVKRDPSGLTTHDLNDHYALMTYRRSMQAIQCVYHAGYRGIEAERRRHSWRSLSIVLGTAMIENPASWSCRAVVNDPSPPTTIRQSSSRSATVCRAFSMISAGTPSFPPRPLWQRNGPCWMSPELCLPVA